MRKAINIRTIRQARSARGERTLHAIHNAATAIIGEHGLAMASQEQIAKRAGISQSTLRHYYPTKDALIEAIYETTFESYRKTFEALLLQPGGTPVGRLLRLLDAHLEHITRSDDAYIFESFAHFARNEARRRKRDAWYGWLVDHYGALLQQIRAELSAEQARTLAVQVLTMVLGAWVTLGRSRPKLIGRSTAEVREALLSGVEALIGVVLRQRGSVGESVMRRSAP
jgi:AcrR family transcriptional regulator